MSECQTTGIQCAFKDIKGDLSKDMSIRSKSMAQRLPIMKFNRAKCRVLNMTVGNPKHMCRLDVEWVEASPEELLGVLVNEKLNMTWQHDLTGYKADLTLYGPCIQSSVASK